MNSNTILAFGRGTFRHKDQVVIDSGNTGLELGYRFVKVAQIYGSETEIGLAFAENRVPHDEFFITNRIWTVN